MGAVEGNVREVVQVIRTSKRKRNCISYYEPNEEGENDEVLSVPDLDERSEDGDYSKTAKKKVKLTKTAHLNRVRVQPKCLHVRPFPFLELPAEIRNTIYEYCLVDHEGLALVSRTKSYRRGIARQHLSGMPSFESPKYSYNPHQDGDTSKCQGLRPALLAVNRQIHTEAAAYLYGQTIHVEDTTALHTFVSLIGQANRLLLRDITLHSWGEGRGLFKHMNYPGLTALAGCTGLHRVSFDCDISPWRAHGEDTSKWTARQLYRDGFIWLDTAAAANGVDHTVSTLLELHHRNFICQTWNGVSDDEKRENELKVKARRVLFHQELKRLLRGVK